MERGTGVDPAAAVQVGIDVCEALHHAHTRTDPKTGESLHLIHRDVSPHNVVIGSDGVSKLIDFGLASSTMKIEQTAPNVVMGKMAYMGPEQARGDAIDATADQFAAVMIMYELLACERFYEGLTANEIWNTVGRGGFRPRKFKTIDRGLRAIMDKALHKSATKRYPTCQALRDALATHQEKAFPTGGAEAVRAVLNEFMPEELDAEWERLAGFAEVSLSGFTAELKAHAPEHTIAKAMPGSGPVRENLPPPRRAGPADPTAIIHANSVSGSGKAVPARGHGNSGAESTELVSRRHRASNEAAEATSLLRDRSARPAEATEVVARSVSASGGVPVQTEAGVVVVHPSQAHPISRGPNKVLVAAVGGMLALLLLLLGALMMTMITSDPPEVADRDPAMTERDPEGSAATGVKRTDPPEDGDGPTDDDVKAEPDGDVAADPPISDDETASEDDAADDDKAGRARRSRRAGKPTAGQRKAERDTKARDAERERQAEQAAAAAADAERAEREQAAARELQRDANQERIARGKARLAKAGYDGVSDYPSKAKKALEDAEADLNDSSAAKRFEKVARGVPKKRKAPPSDDSGGDAAFNYKARLKNLVRKCLDKQPCAKDLSRELGAINAIDKRSSQARRKLQRDIIQCEKSCGLR